MKAISPNIPATMYIHWKYTKETVRYAVWDPVCHKTTTIELSTQFRVNVVIRTA